MGEKRGVYYWVNKKPYISVTEVLKVLNKPALMYWFGREIHTAMLKEPGLTWELAKMKPYEKSTQARNRGTTVHSIVEAWKNIDEVVGQEGPFQGYAKAFKKWLEDHKVEVLENEKQIVSQRYGYGGTTDMLVRLNGNQYPTLIDVKTGKDLYYEVHLQMSAYKHAVEESGTKLSGTAALLLNEDGSYKYQTGQEKFHIFLACLEIYKDINKEQLQKVGYFERIK